MIHNSSSSRSDKNSEEEKKEEETCMSKFGEYDKFEFLLFLYIFFFFKFHKSYFQGQPEAHPAARERLQLRPGADTVGQNENH